MAPDGGAEVAGMAPDGEALEKTPSESGYGLGITWRLQGRLRQARGKIANSEAMNIKLSTDAVNGNAVEREPMPWYLFDHREPWLRIWRDLIIILSLLAMFTIPFNVAFLATDSLHVISMIDSLMDAFFWGDIALSFMTSFETDDGGEVRELPRIARRYAGADLLPDLLSTFPFERFGSGPAWKYTRLARIVRFRRVLRRYNELSLETSISFFGLSLARLVWIVIAALHWAACLFYAVARENEFDEVRSCTTVFLFAICESRHGCLSRRGARPVRGHRRERSLLSDLGWQTIDNRDRQQPPAQRSGSLDAACCALRGGLSRRRFAHPRTRGRGSTRPSWESCG